MREPVDTAGAGVLAAVFANAEGLTVKQDPEQPEPLEHLGHLANHPSAAVEYPPPERLGLL